MPDTILKLWEDFEMVVNKFYAGGKKAQRCFFKKPTTLEILTTLNWNPYTR